MIGLALAADTTVVVFQRITVRVRVKEDPGVLVPHCDGIIVAELWIRHEHTRRYYTNRSNIKLTLAVE